MKANNGYKAIAKCGVYYEARIRHTDVLIHATLKIQPERLSPIVEAWSAKSKIFYGLKQIGQP